MSFSKMYKKQLVLLLLVAIAGIWSCRREESNPVFDDLPVVEAYLLAGKTFELKISRLIPFDKQTASFSPDDINDLEITIETNNTAYTLSPVGNGLYVDSNLTITNGQRYNLQFMFNGRDVTASTVIPSKPSGFAQSATELEIPTSMQGGMGFGSQPDPVHLTWDNPDHSWYVVVVENTEANPRPIRETDSTRTSFSFRNTPVQRDHYDLRPGVFTHFGRHRVILFHLTPDYALLYDESETTSQNLTTPSTGITNGVGIFTGMDGDTLWVTVREL